MTEHYYSSQPDTAHDVREIHAELRGRAFRFLTDTGVFSKKGVDFGSRLLIETAALPDEGVFADVGCGYGPIGIAVVATVPNSQAVLLDVNTRAVALARKNAEINGVADRVTALVSDGFEAAGERRFDAVLINPPIRAGKQVVYRLFAEARDHLKPSGTLWVVIRKKQGAASARDELNRLFTSVDVAKQKKGYWILRAEQGREY
jgi:16S rRNA (guanine1207-N2)-methyltransferase